MTDEYTESTDSDGAPILVRKNDGHTIPIDVENPDLCRLLTMLTDEVLLPERFNNVPSSCRFYCRQMKEELLEFLQSSGKILSVRFPKLKRHKHRLNFTNQRPTILKGCEFRVLYCCRESNDGSNVDGLETTIPGIVVSAALLDELNEDLVTRGDDGEYTTTRMLSSWPIQKAFVYFDISDFSRFPAGQQALVITALTLLTTDAAEWMYDSFEQTAFERIEARLCIGDGYIFCFDESVVATYFAARLARKIEEAVASRHRETSALPVTFHFRAGVHVGPVYRFWEPDLLRWNYVGEGINGGSRVLEAIGKQTDDVVFVSDEVRNDIIDGVGHWPHYKFPTLYDSLHNRGRKTDKHGNPWRVYELNHMNVK